MSRDGRAWARQFLGLTEAAYRPLVTWGTPKEELVQSCFDWAPNRPVGGSSACCHLSGGFLVSARLPF